MDAKPIFGGFLQTQTDTFEENHHPQTEQRNPPQTRHLALKTCNYWSSVNQTLRPDSPRGGFANAKQNDQDHQLDRPFVGETTVSTVLRTLRIGRK